MIWVVVVAIAGAAGFLLLRRMIPRHRVGVTSELLVTWLEELQAEGASGNAVFIQTPDRAAAVQIEVRGARGGRDYVIAYPMTEWSSPYADTVWARARSAGLSISKTPAGQPRPSETMWISFGRDPRSAVNFALEIFENVYNADLASSHATLLKWPEAG